MYWLVYLKNGKMKVITIYENLFILYLFMYFFPLIGITTECAKCTYSVMGFQVILICLLYFKIKFKVKT